MSDDKPVGECADYENFEKALKKLYLEESRKGKRKIKNKGKKSIQETKVRCDLIVSIEDQIIFAWPSSSSKNLIALRLSLQGESSEEWINAINSLAKIYKKEGMLLPIRFNYVKERGRYLKGFVDEYEVFKQLIDRLYIKRPGRKNEIRCDIIVSEKERSIWAWPNKVTQNLIAFCWNAEDVSQEEWEAKKNDLEGFCDKHNIVYLDFNPFKPE